VRDLLRAVSRRLLPRRSIRDAAYPEAFVKAAYTEGRLCSSRRDDSRRTTAGRGLGLAEATVDHGRNQPLGRQRPVTPVHGQDVQHGHAAAPRLEAQKEATCRRSPPASCACSRWRHRADTGTDTTKIKTTAVKKGDRYVVNGQKVWISRVQHSDLMILLARTTPLAEVKKKSEGMSIFIVDLREAIGQGLDGAADPEHGEPRDQRAVLREPRDPGENLIGEEGQGFSTSSTA
jgi:acyl-CoA dehydrogenase